MGKSNTSKQSCLIITYGPVPTPQYQKIEGGGMRAWGLAKGLLGHGVDVTVGVNNSFSQELTEHEGVKIINWGLDDTFAQVINTFDSIVISYCMGDPSVFVADNIHDDVQLILDVYVPIYVEVSAREAADIEQEYKNYFEDFRRHNHVLKRGDYFLCASETQKTFYTGVLSGLGILNPRSYREERILIAPFGIHNLAPTSDRNPYGEIGLGKSDKIVLWFGGLYPWFRIDEFLNAISILVESDESYKFVVVGGKNPFNSNPDFTKQYERAYSFSQEHKLLNKNVFFIDWVDFDDRVNWYKHADFVISINQPGEENGFSWRTRVMDYVWGEVVTLTNGGDPLSEDLLKANAAVKLKDLSASSMVSAIQALYNDPEVITLIKKSLVNLKPRYYWENITEPIKNLIEGRSLPYVGERVFQEKIGFNYGELPIYNAETPHNVYFSKARKAIKLAPRALSYARKKGLKQSARIAVSTAKNQVKKRTLPISKQYVFLSHPLDNSGAPLVLVNILEDLIRANPKMRRHTRVISPSALKNRQKELRDLDVKLDKGVHGLNAPLTGLQLSLKKNDFVLLNTVAVFDNYRHYVFNLLDSGRLKHAYWFIHEDVEQTKVVAPQLLKPEIVNKITKLVESGKLTILVPSMRVKKDYDELFMTNLVQSVELRVDVPLEYRSKRVAEDYSKVSFLLSGTASDGRKGQLIALPAFQQFLLKDYAGNPKKYRDFSVNFVGINDDYISQQIRSLGNAILGKRIHLYPSIPRSEALEITSKSNAVICCSLNETFALYVAEGMAMGHIVLRNDSAGIDEQLVEGKNGYFIDSNNVNQFSAVIEKILNKETSTDKQLQQLGLESQNISNKFLSQDYSKVIKVD